MEEKEIKITPPEGYEIDKENSTFGCIKFKPKSLTYEDVAKELFDSKKAYFITALGKIVEAENYKYPKDPNTATSQKQLEKLLAINRLMNVAKYLNGDWKPLWNIPKECKYFIYIKPDNSLGIEFDINYIINHVYFKSKQLAKQAIDILGEETIRLALSTDW